MESVRRYKRVPINWTELKKCIYDQGFNYRSLARVIGVSSSVFHQTNCDGKMNPLVVIAISRHVDFDLDSIIKDFQLERIKNGRSTSGRISVDWSCLKMCAKKKGHSLQSLSLALGKSEGYLGSCKREGGISEDVLIQIGNLLEIKWPKLISYDRLLVRKEIVAMIREIDYK